MGCSLGVGCDESGACYAEYYGESEQCGRPVLTPAAREELLNGISDPVAREAARLLNDETLAATFGFRP